MAADNVTAYLSEAERLRNIYRGRMKIYAAMEIDYLGQSKEAIIWLIVGF